MNLAFIFGSYTTIISDFSPISKEQIITHPMIITEGFSFAVAEEEKNNNTNNGGFTMRINNYAMYEDVLDTGHWHQLMNMGYDKMKPQQREEAAWKMALQQRQDYLDEIEQAAQAENWKEVCSIIEFRPFIMEEAFDIYYERIPDSMKYKFVVDLYNQNGDSHENIRHALTQLRAYGTPELPDWMKDVITVYRGAHEGMEESPYSISWTTDRKVAEFFANRSIYRFQDEGHVYEGRIRVEDIIAYNDCRSEKEVMQYGSVYDICELEFEPGKVRTLD